LNRQRRIRYADDGARSRATSSPDGGNKGGQ
jgi:hypothetical protein